MDKQSDYGTLPGGAYWRWNAETKTLTLIIPEETKFIVVNGGTSHV